MPNQAVPGDPDARPARATGRPKKANAFTRARRWLGMYGTETFGASDFKLGVLGGLVLFFVVLVHPAGVNSNGSTILTVLAGLGVALLAVVLTAMAILGGLSPDYRRVLNLLDRGPAGAFMPYQTVSAVSGLLTLTALAGLVIGPLSVLWLNALGDALLALLTIWSVYGTVQLVGHTAFHSRMQAKMQEGQDQATLLTLKRSQGN